MNGYFETEVSGYRLMWMMVMFDLPTGSPKERRAYSDFRNMLLDNGFTMSQFSVYFRFCGDREKCDKYVRLVRNSAPEEGDILILFFTDKQFSQNISIIKRNFNRPEKPPEQLALF